MQSLFAQWECRATKKGEGERPLGICCFSSCQQLEEGGRGDLGKVRLRALSRVGSQFCNSGFIHEPNLISIRHSERERELGSRGRSSRRKDHHQKAIDRHKEDRSRIRCSSSSRD